MSAGVKDYANLWSGEISIANNGDGTINQTSTYWVASTSANAISGVANIQINDGTINMYTLGRSSDAGTASIRNALSLKQYSKFEIAWCATAYSDSSSSSTGSFSITLTDAGSNNSTIISAESAAVDNLVAGGGKLRIVYDGTNITITNLSTVAGTGSETITNNSSVVVNVSSWSNVYLSFGISSGGDSTVTCEMKIYDALVVDYFINSNKTQ